MYCIFLCLCLSVCKQKDAKIPGQLYQALNHTAQWILVLQITGVSRDFSRHSKVGKQNDCGLGIHFTFLQRERQRGISLIIKNRHFASFLIDQGTPSSAAFCLFWDRHSVIIPCFLTGSYFWAGKIQFCLHYWEPLNCLWKSHYLIPVKLFLNWDKSIIMFFC